MVVVFFNVYSKQHNMFRKFIQSILGLGQPKQQEEIQAKNQHEETERNDEKKITLAPPVPELSTTIETEATEQDKKEKGLQSSEQKRAYSPEEDLRNYIYPESSLFSEPVQQEVNLFKVRVPIYYALPVLWSISENLPVMKDLEAPGSILVTGSQATGKTGFIHQIILSLLLKKHPCQLKFLLCDIKGLEFGAYSGLEKHFLATLPQQKVPIINDLKELVSGLNRLCIEMDNRYDLLNDAHVKNVIGYNKKFIERKLDPEKGHQYLPSIVLIIDDLGAYLLEKPSNIDIFSPLKRLLSEGYKTGIYCVIGTSQTTGSALPHDLLLSVQRRVVFRLNSKEEYRKFFDTTRFDIPFKAGSFLYNDSGQILKGKTVLFSINDIERIVSFIENQQGYTEAFMLPEYVDEKEFENKSFDAMDCDPLFKDAAKLIVQSQSGSTSLLQRRMKLGYNRAGRLLDQLEAAGIVGPNQGSKVRDVMVKTDAELQKFFDQNRDHLFHR